MYFADREIEELAENGDHNLVFLLRLVRILVNIFLINKAIVLSTRNTIEILKIIGKWKIMYLMYVDDSGDCGMPADGSPSNLFCLSGVVVHELRWQDTLSKLADFRRWLWRRYKVNIEDEIHSADMISKPSKVAASFQRLPKHERLAIIRHFANKIATLVDISIINVYVDKRSGRVPNKEEVFRWAWYSLFQRFENTIRGQNFPGPRNVDNRGIVFPDNTDGKKLKKFLNAMRLDNQMKIQQGSGAFVYINEPIRVIIEDPVLRDSQESYFIQVADCTAFLLKQYLEPSSYMKQHGGNAYFNRLDPVLCKYASRKDWSGKGIVRL
jgi:Protein of unknown function (DUF3800)